MVIRHLTIGDQVGSSDRSMSIEGSVEARQKFGQDRLVVKVVAIEWITWFEWFEFFKLIII